MNGSVVPRLLSVVLALCANIPVGHSLPQHGVMDGMEENPAGPALDGTLHVKRDSGWEDGMPTGPCQSDEDCQDEISVCIPSTGTCETCLAFDVNAQSTPKRCKDYFAGIVDKPHDPDDSHDNTQPCLQESDCPLGKWCYVDAGTCERCTVLHSNQNEYEKLCSLYIKAQAESEQESTEDKLGFILGFVGGTLALLGLIICLGLWYYKKHRKGNGNGVVYNQVTNAIIAQPEDNKNQQTFETQV